MLQQVVRSQAIPRAMLATLSTFARTARRIVLGRLSHHRTLIPTPANASPSVSTLPMTPTCAAFTCSTS